MPSDHKKLLSLDQIKCLSDMQECYNCREVVVSLAHPHNRDKKLEHCSMGKQIRLIYHPIVDVGYDTSETYSSVIISVRQIS